MADARRNFDWEKMFELSIDPELARKRRNASEDSKRDVCTMCGDLCALKTWNRAVESK
jgi:phosphomethylpyrimidine synthase